MSRNARTAQGAIIVLMSGSGVLMRCRRLAAMLAAAALANAPEALAAPGGNSPALTPPARQAILDALRTSEEFPDAPPAELDDGALRAAAARHARMTLGLRIRPNSVNPLWAISPPVRDVEQEIDQHLAAGDLGAWLEALGPQEAQYRSLMAWRCRYAQIVDNGGWAKLPPGVDLAVGSRGPAVEALRVRLMAEGYALVSTAANEVFDLELARAVEQFQTQHALPVNGKVDRVTRQAMNVPAEQRLMQLDANLERWRWAPSLPADRIEVDAGGAEAVLYRAGAPLLSMRAITGDPKHKTPMFASQVESIVFNPPWNVPASIAQQELWPKEAARPGYLAANGFRVVDGHLQQAPGVKNALGAIKFDLPSRFGVYLHDTPSKALFQRTERHLSHGCIRLEAPRELAAALLSAQKYSPDRIEDAIKKGVTQRVVLAQPIPVFVFYWTAQVDAEGEVVFRPDPYRWDAELMQALAAAKAP